MNTKANDNRPELTPLQMAEVIRTLREFGLTNEEIAYAIKTDGSDGKNHQPTGTTQTK